MVRGRALAWLVAAMMVAPCARAGLFADVPITHWAWHELCNVDALSARRVGRSNGEVGRATRYDFAVAVVNRGILLAAMRARPATLTSEAVDKGFGAWSKLASYFQPELRYLGARLVPLASAVEAARRRLQVGLGAHLAGRVVDPTGHSLAAAMVQIDDWPACRVDADGRWRVDGLAPGEHVLTICGAAGEPLAVVAVRAGADVLCTLPATAG